MRGQVFLQQFLRIRVGTGIVGRGGDGETVKDLRARLKAGETLEVGGYPLTPALAADLEALELGALAKDLAAPIHWLEVSAQDPPALTPASLTAVEKLSAGGGQIHAQALAGEAFWAIEETTSAPALLAATSAIWEQPPQ